VIRGRHGATTNFKLTAATQVIASDAVLCTDGSVSLRGAARLSGIAQLALNQSAGTRVLAGVYHIQNVNAYDSRLKNWMMRFHGVTTKYLNNYMGWRRVIERWGEQVTPCVILQAAMECVGSFQLLMQT
jgi:predicted house-cleaning NTP pyrophosphatase (Maf/HAM1 superfamily)